MKSRTKEPTKCSITNRVDVFQRLTIDELGASINEKKFEQLLTDAYPKFSEFCTEILAGPDAARVLNVSCYIEDGLVTFEKQCLESTDVELPMDNEPSV